MYTHIKRSIKGLQILPVIRRLRNQRRLLNASKNLRMSIYQKVISVVGFITAKSDIYKAVCILWISIACLKLYKFKKKISYLFKLLKIEIFYLNFT